MKREGVYDYDEEGVGEVGNVGGMRKRLRRKLKSDVLVGGKLGKNAIQLAPRLSQFQVALRATLSDTLSVGSQTLFFLLFVSKVKIDDWMTKSRRLFLLILVSCANVSDGGEKL